MDVTAKRKNFVDLSGGVNNSVSDFLILDNQSTKMVNLIIDENRISTIKGFTEYLDIGGNIHG